jgi:hypothetical protein
MKMTLIALLIALAACQKEKRIEPDYLAWRGAKAISVNNEDTLGLLDCRSLKSERDHYYLEAYMPWPDKNDYSQSTNEAGEIITLIPKAELYLIQIELNESESYNRGLYLTPVSIQITKLSANSYRYEILANAATLEYFSMYGTDDLKNLKLNEAFIIIEHDGTNYKVNTHPESIYVNESFTCKNSSQGDLTVQ